MDEEDGMAELIFSLRQHVGTDLSQNQNPLRTGLAAMPGLWGTCSPPGWCQILPQQGFGPVLLVSDIIYGYFKETVYKLKMTNKSAE